MKWQVNGISGRRAIRRCVVTFEAEGLFFNGSLFPAQYGQNLDLIFHYGIVDIFRSVFLCLGVHSKCSSKVLNILFIQILNIAKYLIILNQVWNFIWTCQTGMTSFSDVLIKMMILCIFFVSTNPYNLDRHAHILPHHGYVIKQWVTSKLVPLSWFYCHNTNLTMIGILLYNWCCIILCIAIKHLKCANGYF